MNITALQSNFKLQRTDKNFTEYLVLRNTGYESVLFANIPKYLINEL